MVVRDHRTAVVLRWIASILVLLVATLLALNLFDVFQDIHLAQWTTRVAFRQPWNQTILVELVPAGEYPKFFLVLKFFQTNGATGGSLLGF